MHKGVVSRQLWAMSLTLQTVANDFFDPTGSFRQNLWAHQLLITLQASLNGMLPIGRGCALTESLAIGCVCVCCARGAGGGWGGDGGAGGRWMGAGGWAQEVEGLKHRQLGLLPAVTLGSKPKSLCH